MDTSWQAFIATDLPGFYQELLATAPEGAALTFGPPSPAELEAWRRGEPLLRLLSPQVDVQAFGDLLAHVAQVSASRFPALGPEIDQALRDITASPGKLEAVIASLLRRETPESELSFAPGQALGFLVGQALKVALRGCWKQAATWCDFAQWQRGFCPLCGGSPSLEFVDSEGRYLYCGLCEARWPFPGGCPFCGEEAWEPVSLEDWEQGYGLHACRRCRGYLKVVDGRRRGGETGLFWEDLKTLDLDLAAWRRGLISGAVLAGLKARQSGAGGADCDDAGTNRGPEEDGVSQP